MASVPRVRRALRLERAAALGLALALCFVGVGNHGLWIPDEPRVAEIGREMLDGGDLVVPRLGGHPFLETPPGPYWPMLPTLRLFGATPLGARLPIALACAGLVLLVWDLARRLAGRRAGAAAALVVMTTGGVLWHDHRCVPDPWLTLTVTLALSCLARALDLRRGRIVPGHVADQAPPRAGWLVAAYGAAGLCFHAKGVVGVALAGASGLALVIAAGRLRAFARTWAHLPGLLLFAALVLPWPLALRARDPALFDKFVEDSITKRIVKREGLGAEHHEPPWFYLLHAPLLLLPWTLVLPAAWRWLRRGAAPPPGAAPPAAPPAPGAAWAAPGLRHLAAAARWVRQRASTSDAGRAGLLALAAACAGGVVLLSVPGAKRPIYILPVLPALAPLVAAWLVGTGRSRDPLDRATQVALLAATPLVAASALVACALAAAGVTFGQEEPPIEAGPGTLVALAVVTLVSIALAVAGVRAWRARSSRTGPLLLWGLTWVALCAQALAYPALDASRGSTDVVDFLRRACAPAPTFGYALDEMTVALAPFEGKVTLDSSWEPGELQAFMDAHPGGRVLVFERMADTIPTDLRPRLRPVERYGSGRRVYLLYEVQR